MRERITAASQSGSVRNALDAFSIEPEPSSNLLIVACSDENLAGRQGTGASALSSDSETMAKGERMDIIQSSRPSAGRGGRAVADRPVHRKRERPARHQRRDRHRQRASQRHRHQRQRAGHDRAAGPGQEARWSRGRRPPADQVDRAQEPRAATEVVRLLQSVCSPGGRMGGGTGIGARQATRVQFLRDKVVNELAPKGKMPTEGRHRWGHQGPGGHWTPDVRTNSVWITAPSALGWSH